MYNKNPLYTSGEIARSTGVHFVFVSLAIEKSCARKTGMFEKYSDFKGTACPFDRGTPVDPRRNLYGALTNY